MKLKVASRREEKQTLLAVLGSLDDDLREGFFQRVKRELIGLFIALLLAAIVLIIQGTDYRFTASVAVIGFVAGVISGVAGYRVTAMRLWPPVARCVDRSKVEARLRELDA